MPQERVFDIAVEIECPFGLEIMPFLSQKLVVDEKSPQQQQHPFMVMNQKVKKYEKKMLEYLEKLRNHKYKRDSYLAYTIDPSLYIENAIIQ